jgi:hypothetical protein
MVSRPKSTMRMANVYITFDNGQWMETLDSSRGGDEDEFRERRTGEETERVLAHEMEDVDGEDREAGRSKEKEKMYGMACRMSDGVVHRVRSKKKEMK